MTVLVLSIAVLACGPVLGWLLRGSCMGLQFLDGFVLVSILGLCFTQLIPEALTEAGALALVPLVIGFLAPIWLERRIGRLGPRSHGLVLFLVIAGLVAHSLVDGAALAAQAHVPGNQDAALAMGVGVVIHRLPVGLLIWWAVGPVFGYLGASLVLGLIAAGTVGGYALLGEGVIEHGGVPIGLLMALVAGSILHVVMHQTHPEGFSQRNHNCPHWAGAGAVAGAALLYFLVTRAPGHDLAHVHEHVHDASALASRAGEVAHTFLALLVESAPALLLGFLAAGVVRSFLPEAGVEWLRRGGVLSRSFKGMAFGLPLPICSCGVVPVYEGLVRRGAPLAAGMAFLVATPELGLDAILLSLPLLGTRMTLVRLGAAVLVALAAGIVVGKLADPLGAGKAEEDCCGEASCCGPPPASLTEKLRSAWRYGMIELVDHTGPWIFVGLLVGAVMSPYVELDGLATLPAFHQIVIMTLIGMPLYVCAAGATPIAAILLVKGVAPGAVIAFLLAGPATNVTTFGVLRRLHGRRTAFLFVVVVVAACLAAGLLTSLVPAAGEPPAGLLEGHEEHGWFGLACAALVILAAMASLLRQGPRGLMRQVLAFDVHDHDSPAPGAAAGLALDPHDGHHHHDCNEATPRILHDHGCHHDHGCGSGPPRDPCCESDTCCEGEELDGSRGRS